MNEAMSSVTKTMVSILGEILHTLRVGEKKCTMCAKAMYANALTPMIVSKRIRDGYLDHSQTGTTSTKSCDVVARPSLCSFRDAAALEPYEAASQDTAMMITQV